MRDYFNRMQRYQADCRAALETYRLDGRLHMRPFPWRSWLLWGLHLAPLFVFVALACWLRMQAGPR